MLKSYVKVGVSEEFTRPASQTVVLSVLIQTQVFARITSKQTRSVGGRRGGGTLILNYQVINVRVRTDEGVEN